MIHLILLPVLLVTIANGVTTAQRCGGSAGIKCATNYICADDTTDNCDPLNGGIDCGSICRKVCGGTEGLACPTNFECIDDPSDNCDPASGGSDCGGICEPVPDIYSKNDCGNDSCVSCVENNDSDGCIAIQDTNTVKEKATIPQTGIWFALVVLVVIVCILLGKLRQYKAGMMAMEAQEEYKEDTGKEEYDRLKGSESLSAVSDTVMDNKNKTYKMEKNNELKEEGNVDSDEDFPMAKDDKLKEERDNIDEKFDFERLPLDTVFSQHDSEKDFEKAIKYPKMLLKFNAPKKS